MRGEVLGSSAFAGLEPGLVEAAIADGRVDAFAGDLGHDRLGRTDLDPLAGVDAVIHCAASVSFQQPLDEMLEFNVIGTIHLVRALAEAGVQPHFVHVSTAYASGTRSGLVLERAVRPRSGRAGPRPHGRSSPPPARGGWTSRPTPACRTSSTVSSATPARRSARPALRRSARGPRTPAAPGSTPSSSSVAGSVRERSAGPTPTACRRPSASAPCSRSRCPA